MMWRPDLHPYAERRTLVVGLVNNMPAGAMAATERQFLDLLRPAAPAMDVELRLFTCLDATRRAGDTADSYADIASLRDIPVDALIVTGAEPIATRLQDEPSWSGVAWLADWAAANAVPVIWSCMAAHIAVLHMDGISRIRLPQKLSGVFDCSTLADPHPFTAGLPDSSRVQHSRYHDLPATQLEAGGYQIISRSDEAGADIALKRCGAPWLFLQGHPEYAPDTLLREYCRDVGRYLRDRRDTYPATPQRYFDAATDLALADLRERAVGQGRDRALLGELARVLGAADCPSQPRDMITGILTNWLSDAVPGQASVGQNALRALSAQPDRPLRIGVNA
jgi:homoserine O-succinyltransferase